VAFCTGASNFLRENGFPDKYNLYIKDLKYISTKLPYSVNINFTSQITPPIQTLLFYQPTQEPVVYHPTQTPVVYHPTQTPVVYQPTQTPVVYQPTQEPVVYQPTQEPVVYQPTQAPVVYQPTQAPKKQSDKNDTLKKVYISLLLGCILLIIVFHLFIIRVTY
jgi:hypothetical protein